MSSNLIASNILYHDPRNEIPYEDIFKDQLMLNPAITTESCDGLEQSYGVITDIGEAEERKVNKGVSSTKVITKPEKAIVVKLEDVFKEDVELYNNMPVAQRNAELQRKINSKIQNMPRTFSKRMVNPNLSKKLYSQIPLAALADEAKFNFDCGGSGDTISAYLINLDSEYGLKWLISRQTPLIQTGAMTMREVEDADGNEFEAYHMRLKMALGIKRGSTHAVKRIKGIKTDGSNASTFITKFKEAVDSDEIGGTNVLICNAATRRYLESMITEIPLTNGGVSTIVERVDGVDIWLNNAIAND